MWGWTVSRKPLVTGRIRGNIMGGKDVKMKDTNLPHPSLSPPSPSFKVWAIFSWGVPAVTGHLDSDLLPVYVEPTLPAETGTPPHVPLGVPAGAGGGSGRGKETRDKRQETRQVSEKSLFVKTIIINWIFFYDLTSFGYHLGISELFLKCYRRQRRVLVWNEYQRIVFLFSSSSVFTESFELKISVLVKVP